MLRSIADGQTFYLRGAQVAVARKLEDQSLAILNDDGVGPQNSERWSVTLTVLGELVASTRQVAPRLDFVNNRGE